MLNVLVPIDGSDNALRALRHIISPASICREPGQIHLLNVQLPVASGVVRLFLSREDLSGYYQEEAEKALAPAREELEKSGISSQVEMRVGEPA
jgi:nucleotide-binding universal stress UspA family protein